MLGLWKIKEKKLENDKKEIADKLFYRYSGILFKRKRLSEYTLKEKKRQKEN